jgi:hypothetical protein
MTTENAPPNDAPGKKEPHDKGRGRNELRIALIGAAAVLLAAVVGGLIARGGSSADTFHSDLQVLNVAVVDRPPHATIGQTYKAATANGITFTLRNPGNGISVITSARFIVKHFAALGTNGCIPGAGPIPISADYQAALPAVARAGEAINADFSEQVRANSADRFSIGFSFLTSDAYEYPYMNGYGTGASRLYELEVELLHDGNPTPLRAGTILLALPFPAYEFFPGGTNTGLSGACAPKNLATLRHMLSLKATRSQELEEFGKDPKTEACAPSSTERTLCKP